MTTAAPSFHESNIAAARSMRGPVHVDDGETRDLMLPHESRLAGYFAALRPRLVVAEESETELEQTAALEMRGGVKRNMAEAEKMLTPAEKTMSELHRAKNLPLGQERVHFPSVRFGDSP